MPIEIPSPREDRYWDRADLEAEEKRIFEVCNGCRLCFNLCPSFPALFDAVDALEEEALRARGGGDAAAGAPPRGDDDPDGDAHGEGGHDGAHVAEVRDDVLDQVEALERLPASVTQEVVDLCYQCKLCDPICPYTPPHEFAIDFPRLMLRHKAVDARQHGVPFSDRVLGNPDLVGKVGTALAPLANAANRIKPNRVLMEVAAGIHRDRQLPDFASETFQQWFGKRHASRPAPASVEGRKVVLFYTCSVQWNEPQVGRAAVEVLEHNGVTVFAPEMKCCGMPALDGGDVDRATAWARHNVDVLRPYVEAGCDVVSPGPTCSYMLKHEWKEYLGTPEAEAIAERSYDLMEYLFAMRKAKELDEEFPVEVGAIGYHLPCHLKVQKIGYRSRDVLRKLPGAEVTMVDRCSCMDGTWGMKKEYYDLSVKGAKPLLSEMVEKKPATLSSDCLIAKLQIEEGTSQPVQHPIEIVRKAYGDKIS